MNCHILSTLNTCSKKPNEVFSSRISESVLEIILLSLAIDTYFERRREGAWSQLPDRALGKVMLYCDLGTALECCYYWKMVPSGCYPSSAQNSVTGLPVAFVWNQALPSLGLQSVISSDILSVLSSLTHIWSLSSVCCSGPIILEEESCCILMDISNLDH